MGYIYGCDGRNENCKQGVIWDRVNWFTSSIGFCDCCHKRLIENLSTEEYGKLYDACDGENEEAVEKVLELTR